MSELKLEVLKQMFNDLSYPEKLIFEEWVKREVSKQIVYRRTNASN